MSFLVSDVLSDVLDRGSPTRYSLFAKRSTGVVPQALDTVGVPEKGGFVMHTHDMCE
jgi:hypothetical protein